MFIKMYFSSFDKVPHTANHADVSLRDVVLAFEWMDQILWCGRSNGTGVY